jgi:hypothetical protein
LIVVSDNLPSRFYSAANSLAVIRDTSLPDGVALSYGCNNCDWKGLNLCPHGLNGWDNKGVVDGFICPERAAYLKGFYRGSNKEPSFTEWESDYAQGVALKIFQSDLSVLEGLGKQIADCELKGKDLRKDSDEWVAFMKQLSFLTKRRSVVRDEWFQLWKSIRNLQEVRLTREAPKKIEVTHKDSVSVDEFNKIMRRANQSDKVVDADFEVIEDEGD